jgi:hypothetical protein
MFRSRTRFDRLIGTVPTITWSAVFSGVAIGAALLLTLSVLWLAIAGSAAGFATALPWIEAISAIATMFVAGWLAGWLAAVPGANAGLGNGLTVWGLFAIAAVLSGAPALVTVTGTTLTPIGVQSVVAVSDAALWATFWSLIIGAVAAGLGGLLGGAVHGRTAVGLTEQTTVIDDDGPAHTGAPYSEPYTDGRTTGVDDREAAAPMTKDGAKRRHHLIDRRR